MKLDNIRAMTLIALFASVIAVISQIAIPSPTGVPLTLQTFIIALTGCMLGSKKGAISVLVYILIGAVGIPVFSNFKGGLGTLFGYTGGFLISFIFMAMLCGAGRNQKKFVGILLCLSSVILNHACGIGWFSIITENGFFPSAVQVSFPYLIKDIISVVSAYFCGILLTKRVKFIDD